MVQTVAERILAALRESSVPLNDDQLAEALGISPRQTVNAVARQLAGRGVLARVDGPDGKIVNVLAGSAPPVLEPPQARLPASADGLMSEDEVKQRLRQHLVLDGRSVEVAWGRTRGVDIEARREDARMLVEAKGQAVKPPQQVNYFLRALGELIQRMADPDAIYGLALPDHRQSRGLVRRLPPLVWERLQLTVFFVSRTRIEQLTKPEGVIS